jgi:hypothetical protein
MICTIHQPNYLPYPGFFDKASKCDLFILYDTAQFTKNSWQNRNRICSNNGWQWLTLPVEQSFGQKINEVKIHEPGRALQKNWKTIKSIYGKAPFFKKYSVTLQDIYLKKYIYLSRLNRDLIKAIATMIGLDTKFKETSDLPEISFKGTKALVEFCKLVNADTYLSGLSGKHYIDEKLFEDANINLIYQDFKYPVYKQFNSKEFHSVMSIIDVIFNCGHESIGVISNKI